jgi:hypothetical protein
LKLHVALFTLLCLTLAAIPAMAQGISYDNGPVNGQVDAWTINFGFAVSDTFHISNSTFPISVLSFWAWVEPGDTATSVEMAIGDRGFFSDDLFDGTVNLTQSNCFSNNFGFNVCEETANFAPVGLNVGNYYLTLENATTANGNPLYWDENSGVGCMSNGCPSLAQENTLGTIPSEAFTISNTGSFDVTVTTGTTPEPMSLVLFGSGILSVASVLRRKLF